MLAALLALHAAAPQHLTSKQIVKNWRDHVQKPDAYWRLYEDPPSWFATQDRNTSEVGA